MKFILGRKLKMSQIFKDNKVIPVTLIEAGPCFITQVKDKKKDGYLAVQVGFKRMPEKKIKKPLRKKPYKFLREFRLKEQDISKFKEGQQITVEIFQEGEKVEVSGKSKGKGFQGAVKRWGFSGRDRTHGVKHEHRTLGSVGSAWPQKVWKGKKMPGRTGSEQVTVKNLEIVKIDPKRNILAIKGALPGARGTLLKILTK